MKFSQIKKICKDAKECVIYNEGHMQWIGTGEAAYPLEDVEATVAAMKTLFDWPDIEADIAVVEKTMDEIGLAPDDAASCDVVSNGWKKLSQCISIHSGADKIVPLACGMNVLFAWWDRVRPAIRKGEYLDFRLAHNKDEEPLIVVTNGFMVTGILRPMYQKQAEVCMETLRKMSAFVPVGTPNDRKKQEEEPEEQEEPEEIDGQIAMDEMMEDADE